MKNETTTSGGVEKTELASETLNVIAGASTNSQTASIEVEKSGLVSKALRIIAYPIAAATGYWFGSTKVRNNAYDNAKFNGAFNKIRGIVEAECPVFDENGKVIEGLYRVEKRIVRGGHLDGLRQVGKMAEDVVAGEFPVRKGKDVVELFDIHALNGFMHKSHGGNVDDHMKKIGLGTLRKQWKHNSKYQQQEALMYGAAAMAVTIGAIFSIANSKTFSKLWVQRNKDTQESGGPAL